VGSWGPSLYSGDFAADLRRTVAVVARLPFDAERLVDLIADAEPNAATSPSDEDHTVFWLVVADQLARRGVQSARARDTALRIIDSGRDLDAMERLGMSERERAKRARSLAELRARLISPPNHPKRDLLKKPQPYLFEAGDVVVYPTSSGKCINPYFREKTRIPGGWMHDGWAAAVIVERGRAFDFLAWYRPLVAASIQREKPRLDGIIARQGWRLDRPGTVTRLHVQRMEIERLGSLSVDSEKLHTRFPGLPTGRSEAVHDISIANRLHVPNPSVAAMRRRPEPTVDLLAELLV
jgi:hypothetical protein